MNEKRDMIIGMLSRMRQWGVPLEFYWVDEDASKLFNPFFYELERPLKSGACFWVIKSDNERLERANIDYDTADVVVVGGRNGYNTYIWYFD